MNHPSILGYNSDLTTTAQPGNAPLQSVLQSIVPDVLFPADVEAVLSGHVHMLQIVSFATPQPPTCIPGNGGTELVANFTRFPADDTPLPGAVVASFLSTSRFGFMTMERAATGWVRNARDRGGRALTSCTLFARKATRTPLPTG